VGLLHEDLRQSTRESSTFRALDRPPRGGDDMDPSEPVVLRLVERGPIFHGGMINT
jgi:hypothetical protein